jgi:hypothetical protein
MCASLQRASDCIYILLADSRRSPVSVMFAKRSGSPTWIRTRVNAWRVGGPRSGLMLLSDIELHVKSAQSRLTVRDGWGNA